MNEQGKNNIKWGLEVLLLFIGISLGVGSAIGCFNYATLAREAGTPDNIFWLVGLANAIYWVFMAIRYGKKIHDSNI